MRLHTDLTSRLLGRAVPAWGAEDAFARSQLRGRRVLVTGAAGSIGSEVCTHLAHAGCARIALLDSNDHALIAACDALERAVPRAPIEDVLCSVREPARLEHVFARFRPDLVIHAAALKHVHLGERHPAECVLTNVVGVANTVAALEAAGGGRFVLVSTDKAAQPVSVMGAAKRLAELFVRWAAARGGRVSARAVRFGNVFGTQGSVAPAFAAQIAAGGPVRVTHPDMERYFMHPEEAVRLLLRAAVWEGRAEEGESPVFLLEMGAPLRIQTLAERMIAALTPPGAAPVEIVYTGLREGERLSEALYDEHETLIASEAAGLWRVQPMSSRAEVSAAEVAELAASAQRHSDAVVRERVFALLNATLGRLSEAAG